MKKIGLYISAIGIFAVGILVGIFISKPQGINLVTTIQRLAFSSTASTSSTINALVHCPFCQGQETGCDCCHGKGVLTIAQLNAFLTQTEDAYESSSSDDMVICKECNGVGSKNSKTCPACQGEGVVAR